MKNKNNKQRKIQNKDKVQNRRSYTGIEDLEEYRRKKQNFNPYSQNNPYKTNNYTNPYNSNNYTSPYDSNNYMNRNNYTTSSNQSSNKGYSRGYSTQQSYRNPYGQKGQSASTYQPSPQRIRQEIKEQNKMSRKEWVNLQKRKKRKLRSKVIFIFMMTICVVLGAFKIRDHFDYVDISYQTVKKGIINNSESIEGLIVRNETVYKSGADGTVHYIAGEGDKVGKSGQVCVVSDIGTATKLQSSMGQVENNLYNVQDKREELSSYQREIYDTNSQISKEIRDFYHDRQDDQTNNIYTLRKDLDKLLANKMTIYAKDKTSRTEPIQKERADLQIQLSKATNAVIAPQAGIVSYAIDGVEQTINFDSLSKMNYSQFKDVMGEDTFRKGNKSILEVSKDTPLYKLITDDRWYFVTYVQKAKAAKYKENTIYEMNADAQGISKLKFTLKSKVDEENMTKLVLEAREELTHFLPYRIIHLSPAGSKEEGLKIPLQAIVEQNTLVIPQGYIVDKSGEKGIYVKHGETIEFVTVSIAYTEGENTYLVQKMGENKKLSLGDTIKKPDKDEYFKIQKVTTSQGVYAVNGKYAQFKPIEVAIKNDEYAIVKQSSKSKLKEFDQIISNPKNVSEDQLLKYMNVQNQKLK